MGSIDRFFEQHGVDVGKALGLLTIASAVSSAYGMAFRLVAGQVYLDLTAPIGLIVGIALWRHYRWALRLIKVLAWIVVGCSAVVLMVLPFTGTAKLTLRAGNVVLMRPALWKVYVLAGLVMPLPALLLATLYSAKVNAEFGLPDSSDGLVPPKFL
ncbi:hypothetical protein GALL_325440 [mine drainage metagenome]|uniref:Uncharacterized protein n=1 Tax=mine drainage metagenome TaxID=410659 RepID=A0A1J5R0J8_9ZZZZ